LLVGRGCLLADSRLQSVQLMPWQDSVKRHVVRRHERRAALQSEQHSYGSHIFCGRSVKSILLLPRCFWVHVCVVGVRFFIGCLVDRESLQLLEIRCIFFTLTRRRTKLPSWKTSESQSGSDVVPCGAFGKFLFFECWHR
jgi:hypothetical protein